MVTVPYLRILSPKCPRCARAIAEVVPAMAGGPAEETWLCPCGVRVVVPVEVSRVDR